MIKLTWYCQCNWITVLWAAWSSTLYSIAGVFSRIRHSSRPECVFLKFTENTDWIVFIPAVPPASDSFTINVTSESDCVSSEYMLIRFNGHFSFWSFCTMTTIHNEKSVVFTVCTVTVWTNNSSPWSGFISRNLDRRLQRTLCNWATPFIKDEDRFRLVKTVPWILYFSNINYLIKAGGLKFCLFVAISVWNLQLQLFAELLSLRGLCISMALSADEFKVLRSMCGCQSSHWCGYSLYFGITDSTSWKYDPNKSFHWKTSSEQVSNMFTTFVLTTRKK